MHLFLLESKAARGLAVGDKYCNSLWYTIGYMPRKEYNMINQFEMPMYLQDTLPEISSELKMDNKCNPFSLMHTFSAFTGENIKKHNYQVVKRCFKVADKLYSKGNGTVKNAVQNVFVYSLTNIFLSCKLEKSKVLAMLPMSLYTLYLAQVYHKGC